MSWTNVSKPTGSNWTWVNPTGLQTYDDANVLYDDPAGYYDGGNPNAWTDVAKPTGGMIIFPGYATGLITPPTYSREWGADVWTRVAKPS